jgi:hypothetical protein
VFGCYFEYTIYTYIYVHIYVPVMECTLGDMRQRTVDVVGDSHLWRLIESGERLPFEVEMASWLRRGGGVMYLEAVVDDLEWDTKVRSPPVSDLTVVFLGGNDLDRPDVDVPALARRYSYLYERLARLGTDVVVLEQWPRPGARIGGVSFRTNALWFDHLLKAYARGSYTVYHWDRQLRPNEVFFMNDGVHCRPSRYRKVMRYFASAVFAGLRSLFYRQQGHARRQARWQW